MRGSLLFFASIMTVLATSAIADPAAPAPTPAPAATPVAAPVSDSDPNKMVCRTNNAKTGSRLGATRECRTQREWDDIRHQDAHELEKMQARDAMAPR